MAKNPGKVHKPETPSWLPNTLRFSFTLLQVPDSVDLLCPMT